MYFMFSGLKEEGMSKVTYVFQVNDYSPIHRAILLTQPHLINTQINYIPDFGGMFPDC